MFSFVLIRRCKKVLSVSQLGKSNKQRNKTKATTTAAETTTTKNEGNKPQTVNTDACCIFSYRSPLLPFLHQSKSKNALQG